MSEAFKFELVSPEAILVSKPVTEVVIPGTVGDFGVLKDHAPILSSIRSGVVRVSYDDGTKDNIFVKGGFADVKDNLCTILAEDAENVDDLNVIELEAFIAELEKKRHSNELDDEEHYIVEQLENTIVKLDACKVYKF